MLTSLDDNHPVKLGCPVARNLRELAIQSCCPLFMF